MIKNPLDDTQFLCDGRSIKPNTFFWFNDPDPKKAKEKEKQFAYGYSALYSPDQYEFIDGKWEISKKWLKKK